MNDPFAKAVLDQCDETDRQDAQLEARRAELQRRAAVGSGLVYKTFSPASSEPPSAPATSYKPMSAKATAAWDRVVAAGIFTPPQLELLAALVAALRQRHDEVVSVMRRQHDEVVSELCDLRVELSARTMDAVTPIRGKDAA
jgi:hypothetical protein